MAWLRARESAPQKQKGYESRSWHDWVDTLITRAAASPAKVKVDARNVDALMEMLPGGLQKAIISRSVGKAAQAGSTSHGHAPTAAAPISGAQPGTDGWDEDAEFESRAGEELGKQNALWDAPEQGYEQEAEEAEEQGMRRGREMLEAWATTQAQKAPAQTPLPHPHARGEATHRLWLAPAQDAAGFDEDDQGWLGEGTVAAAEHGEADGAPRSHAFTREDGEDEDHRWNQGIGVEAEQAVDSARDEVLEAVDSAGRGGGEGGVLEGDQGEDSGLDEGPEAGGEAVSARQVDQVPPEGGEAPRSPERGQEQPTPGGDILSPAPETPLLPRALHRGGLEDGGGDATPGPEEAPLQWGSVGREKAAALRGKGRTSQSPRPYQVIANISPSPQAVQDETCPLDAARSLGNASASQKATPKHTSGSTPSSPFLERLRGTPTRGGPGGFAHTYKAQAARRAEGGGESSDDDDMVV